MSTKLILSEIQDQILTLTLNRPEALNALNFQLLQELELNLNEIHIMFPTKIKGLIITGFGEKAFAAGADIAEIDFLIELSFLKGRERLKDYPLFAALTY